MSLRDTLNAGSATLPPHLAAVAAALPPHLRTLVEALPERLMDVVATAPVYSERRSGAELVKQHVIPVSHRSLEAWPLPWQHVNGKAVTPTIALLAVAYEKLVAAPVIMGGRRSQTHQSAA
jgi:hypothetical protein